VVTFNAMTGILSHVPLKLLCVALVGLAAVAFLTVVLGWHALRRLFDVPRVPKPSAMYLALGALWIGVVIIGAASLATIAMLRDHRPVDAPTTLADVRCEPVGPDRVRLELRTSPAAAPETYEVPGDANACTVWVRQVVLRPGLGLLGVRVLSRIEGVGPVRFPAAAYGYRFIDLVARRTEALPVAVPPDAQLHSVLVSSLSGPVLTNGGI
jgi:hypothetical protein